MITFSIVWRSWAGGSSTSSGAAARAATVIAGSGGAMPPPTAAARSSTPAGAAPNGATAFPRDIGSTLRPAAVPPLRRDLPLVLLALAREVVDERLHLL